MSEHIGVSHSEMQHPNFPTKTLLSTIITVAQNKANEIGSRDKRASPYASPDKAKTGVK
jgi:hypothetical protein